MEFRHTLGRELTDQEVIGALSVLYPDRKITVGSNGVIEVSYKSPTGAPEDPYQERLARLGDREHRERLVDTVAPGIGASAGFATRADLNLIPQAAVQL